MSDNDLINLESQLKPLNEIIFTLGAYADDLIIDSQNTFLAPIFKISAIRRRPLDKRVLVISTQSGNYEDLMSHFLNETSYGRHLKSVDAETRKELKAIGQLNDDGVSYFMESEPYKEEIK